MKEEKTLLQKVEKKARDYIYPVSIIYCGNWIIECGTTWLVAGKTLEEVLKKFVEKGEE